MDGKGLLGWSQPDPLQGKVGSQPPSGGVAFALEIGMTAKRKDRNTNGKREYSVALLYIITIRTDFHKMMQFSIYTTLLLEMIHRNPPSSD